MSEDKKLAEILRLITESQEELVRLRSKINDAPDIWLDLDDDSKSVFLHSKPASGETHYKLVEIDDEPK